MEGCDDWLTNWGTDWHLLQAKADSAFLNCVSINVVACRTSDPATATIHIAAPAASAFPAAPFQIAVADVPALNLY